MTHLRLRATDGQAKTSQKETLRTDIRTRLSGLTDEQKQKQEIILCEQLRKILPTDLNAVCAYMPLSDEVDITPVFIELLKRDCDVCIPRFDDHQMTFHRVTSLDDLQTGTFGIPEPPKDSPEPDPMTITLVLVPGRAFDRHLNRLGRGKAGYDRWIRAQRSVNPKTQFWGIAFNEQIVEQVPTDEHDERMDAVITPVE